MLSTAFILGFLGSWHCVGMCGPIALMIPGARGKNRVYAILLYHGGKILSYVLIGSIFGLFTVFISSFKIQAIITITAGIIIGFLAFTPLLLSITEKKGYKLFNGVIKLKNRIAVNLNKSSFEYGFYIGFLNGFIPCGMVYIAAIGAMTQNSMVNNALFMVFFGLGTIPFLSALIFTSSFFKSKFSNYSSQIRSLAFIIVSVFMIWRGISSLNTELTPPKEGDNFIICSIY